MAYIIAMGKDGFIASKRCAFNRMMDTQTAVNFVSGLFPNARIYQQLERAPRGARQVWVYYSRDKQGLGRIGRNWEPLAIEGQ